jgi:hypothetical protein
MKLNEVLPVPQADLQLLNVLFRPSHFRTAQWLLLFLYFSKSQCNIVHNIRSHDSTVFDLRRTSTVRRIAARPLQRISSHHAER